MYLDKGHSFNVTFQMRTTNIIMRIISVALFTKWTGVFISQQLEQQMNV